MEARITALEVKQAVLEEKLSALTKSLDDNTEQLRAVAASLNKSKGAYAVLLIAGAVAGFVVDLCMRFFFNR